VRTAALALFATTFGWLAMDDLKDWLQPHVTRAFQTSGIPPSAPCTLPTEHEQMVVVLYWRDGKLASRCMYVGARGTYSRPAPKASTL
jgi:hypothetical protein